MSPRYFSGSIASVFAVDANGFLSHWAVDNTAPGVRPVINLKADTQFSSGDGTAETPFVVS